MSESSKDIKQVKAVGVGKGQLSQGGQGRRLHHLSHVKRRESFHAEAQHVQRP